jgi:hypothetical protein
MSPFQKKRPRQAPAPTPAPPKPEPKPKPVPPAVHPITRTTPFRSIGTLSPELVCEIVDGYPLESECRTIGELQANALALAQAFKESQYGKTATGKNPLGLMVPGSSPSRLMTFPSWATAFVEWQRRMSSPDYAGGVYMPQDMSLEQMIYTYVGGPGCWSSKGARCANGETKQSVELYLQQTLDRLNRYFGLPSTPVIPTPDPKPPTSSELRFGRVPKPANYVEHILAPGVNTAWNNLGPRIPRGLILHRMIGTLLGTDSYFANEARNRALTDFGIGKGADGRHGRIVRWTQPGANVAPHASGPADGIDGDGTAFWNRYKSDPIGTSIFNRDCESIEIEGLAYTSPVPDADYQALVELVAWRVDAWLKIPYTRWPLNNDGVHCLLGHEEVTDQKPCPGSVVYGLVPRLITDVRDRLRTYQTGA